MPIHLKDISVQNLGPHNRFSFELKRLNLIYGHNEHGKTFLVEFIIRSLFRHVKPWQLRKSDARGKVRLSGLKDQQLLEFSPSSEHRIEDFWEQQRPGLPLDFSRLLVVKGAEVDLANTDGGIDKTVIRSLLSNRSILEHIQKSISKTLQETKIENGLLIGPRRGELANRQTLQSDLDRLDDLFKKIDRDVSGGYRRALQDRKSQLSSTLLSLRKAKQFKAFAISRDIERLKKAAGVLPVEQTERLRSELSQYRQDLQALQQKRKNKEAAVERSQHYDWLKKAQQVYQTYLQNKPPAPKPVLPIVAILLVVGASILSFLGKPIVAAVLLALMIGVAVLYWRELQGRVSLATEHAELAQIRDTYKKRFGVPLTGLADILAQIQIRENDFNESLLLEKQIVSESNRLKVRELQFSQQLERLAGKTIAPQEWESALSKLNHEARELQSQLHRQEVTLAQLDVDPSDYIEEDPGGEYSREKHDHLTNELHQAEQEILAENQKLASLKQLICHESGDDIALPWEKVIANVREQYGEKVLAYQSNTAEILGKMVVNEVVQELRQDEESKIQESMKSPFVQRPIHQLTMRYERADLEGDELILSDRFNSFPLGSLSSGAREQVLLALRIGFATKLLQGGSMFLILDDAFQYSDWNRRKLLVDKVAELAADGWQIIYFTMDDNIRTLFDRCGKQFDDDYAVVNLNIHRSPARQLDMLE